MTMLPTIPSTASNYSSLPNVPPKENPLPSDSHLVQQGQHILGACCQQGFQALGALTTSSSVTLKQKSDSEIKEDPEESYSSLRTVDVQDPNSEENTRCREAAGMAKPSSALNDRVNFFAQFPAELVYEMFSKFDPDSLLNMLMVDSHSCNFIKTYPILYKKFLVGQAVKKMLKCAARIEDERDNNQALCRIALLQSSTNPRKALGIAHHLPHESAKSPPEFSGDGLNKTKVICTIIEEQASTNLEQAVSLAEDIEDKFIKDWAFYTIIKVQASINLEKIMAIAEGIQDAQIKAWALYAIAEIQASTDLEQALRTAKDIQNESMQDNALHTIAWIQASANPKNALRIVMEIQDKEGLDLLLHEIFKKLLEIDPEEALLTAKDIQDEEIKDSALREIAHIQASTNLKQALLIAKDIQNEFIKGLAFHEIAEVQLSIDPEQAILIAKEIQDVDLRDEFLCDIVRALASTNPELAINTVENIQETITKSMGFFAIAQAQKSINPEKALMFARDIEIDNFRSDVIREIYKVLASTDLEKAREMAALEDESIRDIALCEIVAVQASIDIDQALAFAKTISDKYLKNKAFGKIIKAQALINLPQAFSTLSEAISTQNCDRNPDLLCSAICTAIAQTNPKGAIRIANRIQIQELRETTLVEIVEAQASIDLNQALAAADLIRVDGNRDKACCTMASRFIDHKDALAFAGNIQNPDMKTKFIFEFSKKLTDPQQTHEVLLQALNAASPIENPARQIRLFHDIVQAMVNTM